jgi:hypothetical protein
MRKATRILTMTGMALVAGLTFSASPAQAASATPAAPKVAAQGANRVVDHFWSKSACYNAGYRGERRHAWWDFDCYKVYRGHFRGQYELSVDYGWSHGHGNWGDDNGNGSWGHGTGDWGHGNGDWGQGNGHGDGHGDGHGNWHGNGHGGHN